MELKNRYWLPVAALLLSFSVHAQTNRYVVFFKDKAGTSFSITQPQQFLSAKAIQRRANQNITITEEDFPVNSLYVNQVKAKGAKTFFTSRWLNCLLVETDPATVEQIKTLSMVQRVDYVAPNKKLSARTSKVRSKKETSIAAATRNQLQMLGIDQMQSEGFRGEGVNIAVFDGGFLGVNSASPFQSIFQENRLKDSFDFVARSGNVFNYDDHGTEVLSVIGAFSEGTYTGAAYKANFFLYVTEDVSNEFRVEEYNWLFAAERADSIGVDVINSSLGYNWFDDESMDYTKTQLDGKTAVISQAASKAIKKGMVVVTSAGNEGNKSWQLVTPPGDVDGILSIGSVTSTGAKSSFSSIGPTSDNRMKPDVMALGSGTSVIQPSGSLGTASGTSLASPLIAGFVAGLWQAHPELTATQIYRALVRSGDQANQPDNKRGYGIPHYSLAKEYLNLFTANEEIILFPNPLTSSSVIIAIKNPTAQPVQIAIYSLDGKVVMQSSLVITWLINPYEYDLSSLASGTYLLKVTSGENQRVIRLVKP